MKNMVVIVIVILFISCSKSKTSTPNKTAKYITKHKGTRAERDLRRESSSSPEVIEDRRSINESEDSESEESEDFSFKPWKNFYETPSIIGIFGKDERKRILNQNSSEYHAVGKLNLYSDVSNERTSYSTSHCSGTLIHPRFVITAAHCVINNGKAAEVIHRNMSDYKHALYDPKDIEFLRSYSNISKYRKVYASKVYVDERYLNNFIDKNLDEASYDIALIKLEKPVSSPFIPLKSIDKLSYKAKSLGKVSGYPYDYNAEKLYESKGDILVESSEPIIKTYMDIAVGMSGAGLRVKDGKKEYVIGVVSQASSNSNNITALNYEKIKMIKYWMSLD